MNRRWEELWCPWELNPCNLSGMRPKRNGNTSCMEKLPGELISHVASFLTLRDATRMKALSRRFRILGASFLQDLDFDWPNMCETPDCDRTTHNCRTYESSFVRSINQFLDNYLGSSIKTLRISFCLGVKYSRDVERWISLAVGLGVTNLRLSFLCQDYVTRFAIEKPAEHKVSVYLVFPCHLLPQSRDSKLTHLILQSCTFGPNPTHQYSSITTLKLYDVPLSKSNIQSILTCFLNLDCLSLDHCNLPFKLTVCGPALNLKSLLVLSCFDVNEIELFAPNLTSFEYAGKMLRFNFVKVPNLEIVYYRADIRCQMGLGYMFNLLGKHVPRIKVLSVYTEARWVSNMPTTLTKLSYLKQLDLFVDPIDARNVVSILKACPVLEKFRLGRTEFVNAISPLNKQHVELGSCADSSHLKEVVISGFAATTSEVAVALCLLETAPNLEKMTLNVVHRVYYGDGVWKGAMCYIYPDKERDRLIKLFKEKAVSEKAVITMVGQGPVGFRLIHLESHLLI